MLNDLQSSISSSNHSLPEESSIKASKMYYVIPALIGTSCLVSQGFAIHALIYNKSRSWKMLENCSYVNYAAMSAGLVVTATRTVSVYRKYGKKLAAKVLLDSVCKPLRPEGIVINSALGAIFGLFL
jgi:hypothetical protein